MTKDEFYKKYFPKEYKKMKLRKMTVEALGKYFAKKSLKKIKRLFD